MTPIGFLFMNLCFINIPELTLFDAEGPIIVAFIGSL